MAELALKRSDIWDSGVMPPEDPMERGDLGVSKLDKVGDAVEAALVARYGKSSIEDVFELVDAHGVASMARELSERGVSSEEAKAALEYVHDLVSREGSFRLLPAGGAAQFYVTDQGDILTRPDETPPTDLGEKIDRIHALALALVETNGDPIAELPTRTRGHLFTALARLADAVFGSSGSTNQVVAKRTPNLAIPDNSSDWVTDVAEIDASGLLTDISVSVQIPHSYIGDLSVELVAPDGTAVRLHEREGGGANDLRKSYGLAHPGMTTLVGKEIRGSWKLRVVDRAGQDVGTLEEWRLELRTGSDRVADDFGELRKMKLYAGVGAIVRRLATVGSDAEKRAAFDFALSLGKSCPYHGVRGVMVSGLNLDREKLSPSDRTRLDEELIPTIAPGSPDYDAIYRITYDASGRPVPAKTSLNFAVMYGWEEDDLIRTGGMKMLEKNGFQSIEPSDKPGYLLFVKKVNADDPNAVCKEIRAYIAGMDGTNMLTLMNDPDIDVIQYDGHSNLGRNIEDSLECASDLVGSKVLALGACATTDRVFAIRNRYPDPKRVQLVNTYESTYFDWTKIDGKKVLSYSENMMLMFGLMDGMSKRKPWRGNGSLNEALVKATDSWSHTKEVNYTNPAKLELLMMTDLDRNGVLDGTQSVWDGGRTTTSEDANAEFGPKEPKLPASRIDGTVVTKAVESLDTFGRYNDVTMSAYTVRTLRPNGFRDLGRDGPMVKVEQNAATRTWMITVNGWYSHASEEAIRAAVHFAFCKAVLGAGGYNRSVIANLADQNTMALLFAAGSLKYDNAYYDTRVWEGLTKRFGIPDEIDFYDFDYVLGHEHERPGHQLTGAYRNIKEVQDRLGPEKVAALGRDGVGGGARVIA